MASPTPSTGRKETIPTMPNQELFQQIDGLQLNERLLRWKEARRNAIWRVCTRRQQLAMESWKETEGEDLEIRRAKMLEKILASVPIEILDFDLIVGRISTGLLTASTAIDVCGDYIPGLWEDDANLELTLTAKGALSAEDRQTLRECTEYFAGKTAPDHVRSAWRNVLGAWQEDCLDAKVVDPALAVGFVPGASGSLIWERALAKGMRGFIEEAEAHLDSFAATRDTDIGKLYFWKAIIVVCQAAIAYAHRYAELARQMANTEPNAARQQELLQIAEICDWVPENRPRTFHEAIQAMHFIAICKNLEDPACFYPVLGRIDQYLWPYFERDYRRGTLTLERAAELLECGIGHWGSQIFIANAGFRETHQTSFGINSLNVGGVDKQGQDVSNLLSYLVLHVIGLMKLSTPTVGVQWHQGTPRWLLEKGIDTNVKVKGGIPLFENGDHVVQCFMGDGFPVDRARDWYGLGCVSPVLSGTIEHSGSEGMGAINVAAVLDIALHDGRSAITGKQIGLPTGDPRDFTRFDQLYGAFKEQFEFIVKRMFWLAAVARQENPKYVRLPFLSMLNTEEGMEKGKDTVITDPAYHTFILADRAVIDTADSLLAIKKLVFEEKKLTMAELMEALDSNFAGPRGEEIRRMCLAVPKYGNDIDEADVMVREVGAFTGSLIHAHDNSPDQPFHSVREGLSWHYYGGLGVGALANGRKAKEPLNDGSMSPMRGMDKAGPTAVLRSVLKAGFHESFASALNQKFSATVVQSPESRSKLVTLTDTFLRQGGQHIQYNLVDTQELLDAKAHPENHSDLVVRIGGFSAYFVQLSPEIQDDVIDRSQQGL
jgi:formate C-acetyltransferase